MWQKPIFDRTQNSCLSETDLNRIYGNLNYLAELFDKTVEIKTWEQQDYFYLEDAEELLSEVNELRQPPWVNSQMPKIPSTPLVLYSQFNDIEKIIFELYYAYFYDTQKKQYTGEFMTNERIGVL